MTQDPRVRADRWRQFYEEDGGLRDMIDDMRRAYFERVGELSIKQDAERHALALADKILQQLDGHIRKIADTGLIEARRDYVRKIEELPPQRRRFF